MTATITELRKEVATLDGRRRHGHATPEDLAALEVAQRKLGDALARRSTKTPRLIPDIPDIPDIPARAQVRVGNDGTIVANAHVVTLSTVQPRAVRWLWRGYLPLGKLVIVDGFPGQGKSTVMFDIAARLSRGAAMPDNSRAIDAPGETLILTYEDDVADTILPRIIAADGRPALIHVLAGVSYDGDDTPLPPTLPKDIALLDVVLSERPGIRLVIIDPLMAAVSADVDSHRDQDIRRPLARLAKLAEKHNVCVVAVRHVKKSPGTNAIAAGGGSIGIIGQARVGLIIDRHPDDETASVLAVSKSNVSALAPSLAFRRASWGLRDDVTDEEIETSKLEWTGELAMSADDLLAARDDAPPVQARDDADWLRDVLKAGPVERKELLGLASAQGINERRLERLARRIGAEKKSSGFGRERMSRWRLPDAIPDTHLSPCGNVGNVGNVGNEPPGVREEV